MGVLAFGLLLFLTLRFLGVFYVIFNNSLTTNSLANKTFMLPIINLSYNELLLCTFVSVFYIQCGF